MMCAIQTSAVAHRQRHLWEFTRVDIVNYSLSKWLSTVIGCSVDRIRQSRFDVSNCAEMKQYHSFGFQFKAPGGYCFKPLLLIMAETALPIVLLSSETFRSSSLHPMYCA